MQAFSTGLLSAFGHNPRIAIRDFQGEAQFSRTNGGIDGARVDLSVASTSLEVIDDISEKDKAEINRTMHEQVLETGGFPEITYACSQVSASGNGDRLWVALNGELTLHGVTRALPISARVVINGMLLRASGEFAIKQTDFEITPVQVAAGAIKLKNELKCTFDLVARKQE